MTRMVERQGKEEKKQRKKERKKEERKEKTLEKRRKDVKIYDYDERGKRNSSKDPLECRMYTHNPLNTDVCIDHCCRSLLIQHTQQ